jgi:hypothetical protein
MNNGKPIGVLMQYSPPFLKRFIARAPIHMYTYSKAIRAAKPYIRFVYIDMETVPIVTNVHLDRPDLYALFIDANSRMDRKDVDRGVSTHRFNDRPPAIRTHTVDPGTVSPCATVPIRKWHVSLDIPIARMGRTEMPAVRSVAPDVREGRLEKAFSIIRPEASRDAVFHFDAMHEGIPAVRHVLDAVPAQCTNAAKSTVREYESQHHSVAIVEPHCHVYPVSKALPQSRIVRQRRYARVNHVVPGQDGA